jgi:hypothetical protein
MLQEISGYLEKALKTRHTGSAFSPLIWLNGIVSVPCLLISAIISPPMSMAFFALAVVLVLYSMAIPFLAKNRPKTSAVRKTSV